MWFLDGSSSAEVIFHDQSNLILGVEYFFKKKKIQEKILFIILLTFVTLGSGLTSSTGY
jgi:hypothetical protein